MHFRTSDKNSLFKNGIYICIIPISPACNMNFQKNPYFHKVTYQFIKINLYTLWMMKFLKLIYVLIV